MSKEPIKQELYQSETVIIKRNQINFHPRNPKHHSDDAIRTQKKNFKNVGFLGGLVWNSRTGNLISGHKRLSALDLYYKNTPDNPVNYDVKVESVVLTDKQELEQLIYMDAASANTPQDADLLKIIIPDIDYRNAGLTEQDLSIIGIDIEIGEGIEGVSSELLDISDSDKKEKIKATKKAIQNGIEDRFEEGDPLLCLSFDNFKRKAEFMRRFDFDIHAKFIKGELFSEMIERVE